MRNLHSAAKRHRLRLTDLHVGCSSKGPQRGLPQNPRGRAMRSPVFCTSEITAHASIGLHRLAKFIDLLRVDGACPIESKRCGSVEPALWAFVNRPGLLLWPASGQISDCQHDCRWELATTKFVPKPGSNLYFRYLNLTDRLFNSICDQIALGAGRKNIANVFDEANSAPKHIDATL